MSEHAETEHHINYVRIWAYLVVLLALSVMGPMIGHKWITLMTAFGIAVVKAYLVAKNFMHINLAQRYVTYLVTTMLVFMLLFFAGVSPDVMKLSGHNWVKPAWVEANAAADAAAAAGHGEAAHE
jgi:caa(3)-type oxidase subunit IV